MERNLSEEALKENCYIDISSDDFKFQLEYSQQYLFILNQLITGFGNIFTSLLLFQAKQLCLGIIRTLILERRPVSVVAKAIHVLVTSYSHSIKTDSYLKGVKAEKTSTSGVQHAGSPLSGADVSASGADALGKSIIDESSSGVDSGSLYKSSIVSSVNSEGEVKSANPKGYSPGTTAGCKANRENSPSTESHSAQVMQSSLLGQEESQLTTPAISPDEMYSFVFAPVDEEMVGDPSYLVTIIVEFLHRYVMLA